MNIPVEMKRGGNLLLQVFGTIYASTDGAGEKTLEIDIEEIRWPNGGKMNMKNIKDINQVQDAFLEATNKERENARN